MLAQWYNIYVYFFYHPARVQETNTWSASTSVAFQCFTGSCGKKLPTISDGLVHVSRCVATEEDGDIIFIIEDIHLVVISPDREGEAAFDRRVFGLVVGIFQGAAS